MSVRTPAGSLEEVFNNANLAQKLESGDVADAEYARTYADRANRFAGEMAAQSVEYYRKHGIPGRRLAQGRAGQWMKSADKKIVFLMPERTGQVFANVDINNCFVSLWHNELGRETDVVNTYPAFTALKNHYKHIRAFLAEYLGISVKDAKKELIRIIHLGFPKHDLPYLWNLSVEMHEAAEALIALDKFAYLEGMFVTRRNPIATKIHYALASVEDTILSDMENELKAIPGLSFNTYMFDGAIVFLRAADIEQFATRLDHVAQRWNIGISYETW